MQFITEFVSEYVNGGGDYQSATTLITFIVQCISGCNAEIRGKKDESWMNECVLFV